MISRAVLGMRVDACTPPHAAELITDWGAQTHGAASSPSRLVFAANVHMTMEAWDDPAYAAVVDAADLVLPDGMPLVWALRLLGVGTAQRVRMSPDLFMRILSRAAERGLRVGLYGGSGMVLAELRRRIETALPQLTIAYSHAPPFHPLTEAENAEIVHAIQRARLDLLFVALGCPKQELWMAARRERLECAMVGVGYAFDLVAGRLSEAPRWMQERGLEWVYRLAQDPRRLWRRYARHNPRFVVLLAGQVVRERLGLRAARRSRQLRPRSRSVAPRKRPPEEDERRSLAAYEEPGE